MDLKNISFILLVFLFLQACNSEVKPPKSSHNNIVKKEIKKPAFNSDSAYLFIQKQVDFGPRVPGTASHKECAQWLTMKLSSYGGEIHNQHFKARTYDGKIYDGINIIASFQPEKTQRIMLSSHWDSRPFADHDPDKSKHYQAIDGANDGASGVGVLLEMARLMQLQHPNIGVDIMLWDLEDYGEHNDAIGEPKSDTWCLGSQYWSKNLHDASYSARYGVLLDMVGAKNPVFCKEYYSMQFASFVVEKVWKTAQKLGYQSVFRDIEEGVIMDDHFYINRDAGIPTVDIIHYDSQQKNGFFPHWHTVNDNMESIDKSTLKMVGDVLVELSYSE